MGFALSDFDGTTDNRVCYYLALWRSAVQYRRSDLTQSRSPQPSLHISLTLSARHLVRPPTGLQPSTSMAGQSGLCQPYNLQTKHLISGRCNVCRSSVSLPEVFVCDTPVWLHCWGRVRDVLTRRTTTLHHVTYRASVAGCSLIGEFAAAAQLAVRQSGPTALMAARVICHSVANCTGHWCSGSYQQQSPTSLSHPDRGAMLYSFIVAFQPTDWA